MESTGICPASMPFSKSFLTFPMISALEMRGSARVPVRFQKAYLLSYLTKAMIRRVTVTDTCVDNGSEVAEMM